MSTKVALTGTTAAGPREGGAYFKARNHYSELQVYALEGVWGKPWREE